MNPYIKAFIDYFSDGEDSEIIKPPKIYTQENINDKCIHSTPPDKSFTILELAVCFKHDHYLAIEAMLELGAEITDISLNNCLPIYYNTLLEFGNLDPNRCVRAGKISLLQLALTKLATLDEIHCIIDYGGKPPKGWEKLSNAPMIRQFEAYASLSNSRVVSSRKALAALIICCKQRTHQGTLVFGAVRDVLFAVAREMWAQKGPADKCCGPRSALWARSKEWRVE